jgi:hypothetical protein
MNRSLDPQRRPRHQITLAAALATAVALVGLGAYLRQQRSETLPSQYGRRVGGEAPRSVNGTFVFGEMFRQRGWRVTSHDRLSPALDRYDALVWVPDDFRPPSVATRTFLEDWLASQPGRTVIYVGRDYDSAWRYWTRIAADAPPKVAEEIRRRRAAALADWEKRRSRMPANADAGWFHLTRDAPPHEVHRLTGPWAEGIDARQLELFHASRLAPPTPDQGSSTLPAANPHWEVLLADGDQPWVIQVTDPAWPNSRLLLVANGALVLNYPLAFAENRKLAGRLIEVCGSPARVAFIESGPGGPTIASGTPPPAAGWTWLTVWPLNMILLHLVALGLVAVLAKAPRFGRARELPAPPLADFSRHVAALGLLLARSGDRQYAAQRLAQYHQTADRSLHPRLRTRPPGSG